jgi:hypothetical protein
MIAIFKSPQYERDLAEIWQYMPGTIPTQPIGS